MTTKFNTNETPVTSVKMNKLSIGHYTTVDRDALPVGDTILGMVIYNEDTNVHQKLTQLSPAIWEDMDNIIVIISSELVDETTLPSTGVKKTIGIPFNCELVDVIGTLTVAGTGAVLFEFDVLYETGLNTNTFSTIFSTRVQIDASEFTSVTATTPMVLSVTTLQKGRRLQLKIQAIDTNTLGRGPKLQLMGYKVA